MRAVLHLTRLCLGPAPLNLLPPVHPDLVVLLEQSEAFANDLARVVVQAALDLCLDEALEFARECGSDPTGGAAALRRSDSPESLAVG
jgi:hypothetical protein